MNNKTKLGQNVQILAALFLAYLTCAPVQINTERDSFNLNSSNRLYMLFSSRYPSNTSFEFSTKSSDGTKYYARVQICFGKCFKEHRCINAILLALTSSNKSLGMVSNKVHSAHVPELISLCVPVLTDEQYAQGLLQILPKATFSLDSFKEIFEDGERMSMFDNFHDPKLFQLMAKKFRSMDPGYKNPNTREALVDFSQVKLIKPTGTIGLAPFIMKEYA